LSTANSAGEAFDDELPATTLNSMLLDREPVAVNVIDGTEVTFLELQVRSMQWAAYQCNSHCPSRSGRCQRDAGIFEETIKYRLLLTPKPMKRIPILSKYLHLAALKTHEEVRRFPL
jgi:hypothetical protein